jgi:SH3-like domain-containing protein
MLGYLSLAFVAVVFVVQACTVSFFDASNAPLGRVEFRNTTPIASFTATLAPTIAPRATATLEPTPTQEIGLPVYRVVSVASGACLRLRYPLTTSPQTACLENGTLLEVLFETGDWLNVLTDDGQPGYVWKAFTEPYGG